MYLIVGLGNPGRQYEATRHNMGFDVIDKLVEEYNVPQSGVKFNAMYGKGKNRRTTCHSDEAAFLYESQWWSCPGYGKLLQNRSGDRDDRYL